jgi:protein-S-isoprenylcysteine O-methyltransferase Ste14
VTRPPIYTGIIGMLVGSCLVFGAAEFLLALIVFVRIHLYRIPREERLMIEAFGERYARYRSEVPRLLPRPRR